MSLTIFNSKLQEEKIPPKPFVYEYGGVDYDGKAFAKTESQDEYGVVSGKQMFFFQKINWNITLKSTSHLSTVDLKTRGKIGIILWIIVDNYNLQSY